MILSKRIAQICIFFLVLGLSIVLFGPSFTTDQEKTVLAYEEALFGQDIIEIDIQVDDETWQGMLDSSMEEAYIKVDVIVNGTVFKHVGIRPKGNTSLSQVASSDSDRYSFRLQFDEYIDGQTCFGLQSFVLNNMYADNSYMKEYLSYELMREAGVDVPYYAYASISRNGENIGFYLAVELYNESYEQRVFGRTDGAMYNVKSAAFTENMSSPGDGTTRPGGQMPDWTNPDAGSMPFMPDGEGMPSRPDRSDQDGQMPEIPPGDGVDMPSMPTGDGGMEGFDPEQFPAIDGDMNFPGASDGGMSFPGAMGGGFGSGGGGDLVYTDDEVDSYQSIFANVVGKGDPSSYERVIEALKALSEGRDLETYFDVEQVLRYLAAHTVVVNLDSYSSSMAQNYYINEQEGQLTILPWDYNLAFGSFQVNDASTVINFPIDTPVSGVTMESRPLISKLLENETYLDLYHSYLQDLVDKVLGGGKITELIEEIDTLIAPYVKDDPTSFTSFDGYQKAVSTLSTLSELRTKSIEGQLSGEIPSTTSSQKEASDALIDASGLDLTDLGGMGQMMGGNGNPRPNMTEGQMPNLNQAASTNQKGNDLGYNQLIIVLFLLALLFCSTLYLARRKKRY